MIGQHIFPLIVLCIARLLENLPTDLSAHDLHTYVYTYAHVYIHVQTHKYIHTYKQTDIMKVLSFLTLFFPFFPFLNFPIFLFFVLSCKSHTRILTVQLSISFRLCAPPLNNNNDKFTIQ